MWNGKNLIKGSLYLLLGHKQRPSDPAARRLDDLLVANESLSTVCASKNSSSNSGAHLTSRRCRRP